MDMQIGAKTATGQSCVATPQRDRIGVRGGVSYDYDSNGTRSKTGTRPVRAV